jgi:hypothetical protein
MDLTLLTQKAEYISNKILAAYEEHNFFKLENILFLFELGSYCAYIKGHGTMPARLRSDLTSNLANLIPEVYFQIKPGSIVIPLSEEQYNEEFKKSVNS